MSWLAWLLAACSASQGPPAVEDADGDGDGLVFSEEAALGTDPWAEDSDGDGFGDGAEVEAGSHPLDPWSHPYVGGYTVGACAGARPGATGTLLGEVPPNVDLLDQHGEPVSLWSFCGRVVVMVLCAADNIDCRRHAQTVDEWTQTHGEDGLSGLVVLPFDSDLGAVEVEDLADFADAAGLQAVPVLLDEHWLLFLPFEWDWLLPTWVVLDRDMRIVALDEGEPDPVVWLQ